MVANLKRHLKDARLILLFRYSISLNDDPLPYKRKALKVQTHQWIKLVKVQVVSQ